MSLEGLFLQSQGYHPEVPKNLYMNGIVSSVPWHGCQEYGITWDTDHHKSTVGLWTSNLNFKYKQRGAHDTRKKNEKHAYSVMTSHPIYIHLQCKYGLDLKKRKRVEDSSESKEVSDEQ